MPDIIFNDNGDLFFEILYPLVITALLFNIYIYTRLKIKRTEKSRLNSIQKRVINEAVETDSPIDNDEQEIKDKGIIGIEDRFSFISKALPVILLFFWSLLIVIPYLGKLPSIYISIITAVFSVLAAIALRPFLENMFAGVVISFFRFISIGDTVTIDGHYGMIEEIGLSYTVLKRWDWERIVIPNTKLIQKEIRNMTMTDSYIWTHVKFYVSPDADIEMVEKIAKSIPIESRYNIEAEEPSFWVMEIEKEAVECWIAAWADGPGNAWELRAETRKNLIIALQKYGISFHKHNLHASDDMVARK